MKRYKSSRHLATLSTAELLARQFPIPQFFRAPTDNDKSFGNWIAKDWKKTHLDSTLSAIPLKDGEYVYHYGEDGHQIRLVLRHRLSLAAISVSV